MPTLSFNLSEAEIEKLRYERYAYPHPMIQKRIFSVYLKVTTTLSNRDIGLFTGLHPNTVARYIKVYRFQGFEGLLSNNYGTNQSELEPHSRGVIDSLIRQPVRTVQHAAERIRQMTGIQRSAQQVRTYMKGHGLRFMKCGHIPAKANNEQQHQWVAEKLQPAIEAAQKGKVHLFFLDAAHFMLQPFVCCLWCAFRVYIKAASGRNRISVLGAVHAVSKRVITLTLTNYISEDTLVEFLALLKKKFCDKPIVIVLDNARYQHCQAVTSFAASLGMKLLFLPPYSPNLNIIERLWKFAKENTLYAKYYDDAPAFHLAVESFFINNRCLKLFVYNILSLKLF